MVRPLSRAPDLDSITSIEAVKGMRKCRRESAGRTEMPASFSGADAIDCHFMIARSEFPQLSQEILCSRKVQMHQGVRCTAGATHRFAESYEGFKILTDHQPQAS